MKTVFRVIFYLKRYPLLAVAQMACAVLMTLLVVVFPGVAQTITGEVIPQRDFDRLLPLALLATATFFATNLFNALRIILNNTFEQ
ncbi:MAG: ABC transporter ATP-binding protein, partial [Verrucomicrobia bacterium]|nr:ABC transporter ATP-binding protein [Verrucomicrobiota bacterium]